MREPEISRIKDSHGSDLKFALYWLVRGVNVNGAGKKKIGDAGVIS